MNSITKNTILLCSAAIGTVFSTATAISATIKMCNETSVEERKDIFKMVKKYYIPTAILSVSSISSIFLSKNGMKDTMRKVQRDFTSYRKCVNRVFGPDADDIVKKAIQVDKEVYRSARGDTASTYVDIIPNPDQIVTFYDSLSERYIETTPAALQNAEYRLNRNLSVLGGVTLNEFYDFLGVPRVLGGDIRWWNVDSGYNWVDFNHVKATINDDMECWGIYASVDPESDFPAI